MDLWKSTVCERWLLVCMVEARVTKSELYTATFADAIQKLDNLNLGGASDELWQIYEADSIQGVLEFETND